MAKSFKTLRNKMSVTAQKNAQEKTQNMIAEMALNELRLSKNFLQEDMADALETKQANVSRLERRTDMYISTLRSYIQALGGELEITAKFPDGKVRIKQFEND
ncbi:MAG: XRE family transcriptional regulator [Legionellales bacterium]|nr:XRE family transcriptional regulator [Legionellales bacterium]